MGYIMRMLSNDRSQEGITHHFLPSVPVTANSTVTVSGAITNEDLGGGGGEFAACPAPNGTKGRTCSTLTAEGEARVGAR